MTRERPLCVVLDDYQGAGLEALEAAGAGGVATIRNLRHHISDPGALARELRGAEVAVAIRERTVFDRTLLDRLTDLRLLVTLGQRNASIDLEAAADRGIKVAGTRGAGNPTVEMTWALILGLCRHVASEHATMRAAGPWQTTIGTDLEGHTLALLGLGRVGAGVARVGRAFGMRIRAFTPSLDEARAAAAGVELATSLEDLLETADILSLHLPLTEGTRGVIGAAELARMKRTALLVNTSRGPVVEQSALLDFLRAGDIGGAALDVFNEEPLPQDHALRKSPRLLTTPHLGYVTRDNYAHHFADVAEAIRAYREDHDIPRRITKD